MVYFFVKNNLLLEIAPGRSYDFYHNFTKNQDEIHSSFTYKVSASFLGYNCKISGAHFTKHLKPKFL